MPAAAKLLSHLRDVYITLGSQTRAINSGLTLFQHRDSFDFAKRMLEEAHVAATPGIDFDPLRGNRFLRFCYAGSAADMREAVERIGGWLKRR